MYSYTGKILRVDLSTGKLWDEPLNQSYARDFVGGSGLAARYLYDMLDHSIDPLGPDNPLMFMTGPLVGTAMPSAGRFSVCARSPLTGIWGEANSGGFFGPELRNAGYDGLLVTGQAETPVWLSIKEGQAALHPAGDIWGCDSYVTQQRVIEAMQEPRARVACIGLAGENLVKIAGVMNDHGRTAARTGLGAVMGSKRLKAIGVRGTGKISLADPARFKEVVRPIASGVQEDMAAYALQLAGTAGYVNMGLMSGDMPVRYYRQGEWEEGENLSGVILSTQYFNRRRSCSRCPIACGRETHCDRFGEKVVDGPEYESLGALGTLVMVSDMETVIYANHLCNLYGLDTISMGNTIALAFELFERGLITKEDTGGLELGFGDGEALIRLIEMTARREGIGDFLAEGSAALAERYGVPELAATVNRLEIPMHDPRAFSGMAVSYILSPRGACHMEGDMYGLDTGQSSTPELDILPGDRFESTLEKGRMAARQQAWRNLYNALTLCQFQNPGAGPLLAALNSATGWELEEADLILLGKRIATLKRLINLRLGLARAGERLPEPLMKPMEAGGTEGNLPDVDILLAGAYEEYGWDIETGRPKPETLAKTLN